MPSIFTLQGPSLGHNFASQAGFGYAGAAATPSRTGGLSSVLVLGDQNGPNIFGLGAAGEQVSIQPLGTMTINGLLMQIQNPIGPYVDSNTWLGTRPPSVTEQGQIAACKNTWGAFPLCVTQGVGVGMGPNNTCSGSPGSCFKSNFTVPTAFQNFYRDSAIEKLYNPTTGEVLVIKNDPSWLQSGLDWVLKNCKFAVIGAGVASGGAAGAAVGAGCALLTSGTPGSTGLPASSPGTPGFKPAGMSTGTKVAIGLGAAGLLGGLIYGLSKVL